MKIRIVRDEFTNVSTVGKLYIDDVFICNTLEDAKRDSKLFGITCINPGEYKCKLTYSNRFKQVLPELFDVPNFKYIRIHAGNYHTDTEGCILVGTTRSKNFVGNSRIALATVLKTINNSTDITVTVE